MPTYERSGSFVRDYNRLSQGEKDAVKEALAAFIDDLRAGRRFRSELRVKGVQGASGVFEMTWADDGRATFEYGDSLMKGGPHIIWRRIGGHEIFKTP